MTDKTIDEVENVEVEAPEQKQTVTQQAKSEKTFTQDELDRTVQARLRREKEANKSLVDTLTADVALYEESFKKVIAAQTADWDDGMKVLFETLPVKEQLQKLADEEFMAKVHRKNIPPKTPREGASEHTGFRHSISRI
jgi:NADPH-dependent curcumin reductase CurA